MRPIGRTRSPDRHAGRWCAALGACAAVALALAPGAAAAAERHGGRAVGHYAQRNLVSDQRGKAQVRDPHLVNAWGLTFGPTTPAWVADNGMDVSTLYSGGVRGGRASIVPLVVHIPGGAPTGAVFNDSAAFPLPSGMPARFIFASEAGMITGWPAPPPMTTDAQTVATVRGAIFKGLAIAHTASGPRLYATDFHHGRVDVWDGSFARVRRPGAFRDRAIPRRFAPFGIQEVGGDIVVTYAKQDSKAEDDVAGRGNGFVDVYDTRGRLLRRFAAHGPLDSPWGIVRAPRRFGRAGGALLVGNFGDGRIDAYNPRSGRFLGALRRRGGRRIAIDGLWALRFGNGVIGSRRTLLFTAGPHDEAHGLFGELVAARR